MLISHHSYCIWTINSQNFSIFKCFAFKSQSCKFDESSAHFNESKEPQKNQAIVLWLTNFYICLKKNFYTLSYNVVCRFIVALFLMYRLLWFLAEKNPKLSASCQWINNAIMFVTLFCMPTFLFVFEWTCFLKNWIRKSTFRPKTNREEKRLSNSSSH